MTIIGPKNRLISGVYSKEELGNKGKKRIKLSHCTCLMLDSSIKVLSLIPYIKQGIQYGKCKDGPIPRKFFKIGKFWKEAM